MKTRLKTVRGRMAISYCLLFLLIIVPMTLLSYNCILDLLRKSSISSHEKVLRAGEEVLLDVLENYRNTARLILASNVVQDTLQQEDASDTFFMSYERSYALQSVCRQFTNNVSDMGGIYIFDNMGHLFYQDQGMSTLEVQNGLSYQEIEASGWFQAALDAKGMELFYGQDLLFGKEHFVSCVKVLNRLNSSHKLGLMVMTFRKEAFRSVLGLFPIEKDAYLLMDGDTLIYQRGLEELDLSPAGDNSASMAEEGPGLSLSEILEGESKGFLVDVHESSSVGWKLCHIVRTRDIFSQADSIRLIIMVFTVGAIPLFIGFAWFQARHIMKPLEELKENFREVGQGRRMFHNTFPDDEIGDIGREFQHMVTKNLALQERIIQEELVRKKAQLALLQSQINPHFLYNTLETLYWMAVAEEADDVAELTQALSEIFRISLSEGEDFIPVSQEIRFIEDYLLIQNKRFDNKFQVQIDIEEESLETYIPKQILQPFVENAIYHGLEPKMEQGLLSIHGTIDSHSGKICFIIMDDGVGFSPGVDPFQGYAIQNVYQRLRLYYGEEAELSFISHEGQGTTVKIAFPIKADRLPAKPEIES